MQTGKNKAMRKVWNFLEKGILRKSEETRICVRTQLLNTWNAKKKKKVTLNSSWLYYQLVGPTSNR